MVNGEEKPEQHDSSGTTTVREEGAMRSWRWLVVALGLLAIVACEAGTGPPGRITILEPEDGATVTVPFTIRARTTIPTTVGEEERRNPFVLVYIDGVQAGRMEGDTFRVTDLLPGQHGIHVSVHDPDGEPVGLEDEVDITVEG